MDAAAPSPRLVAVLNKLKKVQRSGAGWKSLCPSHADQQASLSISEDNGTVMLHCHAGCSWEQITTAMGATPEEFFAQHAGRQKAPAAGTSPLLEVRAKTWTFILPDGSVAKHKRLDLPGGKRIWWERNGQKSLAGWASRDLPLYEAVIAGQRSPNLAALIVEGEKCADAIAVAANAAGYVTFGTVCGASVTPSDDVLRTIADWGVTLWPDNDAAGLQHMHRIAARLDALGCLPFWLEWPDAPAKGDAADFIESGGDFTTLDAVLWEPPAEPEQQLQEALLPRIARVLN